MGYKLRAWVTPKSLHRGSVHFHSCPFSVHILTFLLRPRRSAARTVPLVLAATSLLSKGIRPSTLCSSRLDPRCCYSPGLRRRQTSQQVLARGRRVSISAFPRSSGCALGRGGWRGPPRHGGWTGVAAAAALAAGGAGAGAGRNLGRLELSKPGCTRGGGRPGGDCEQPGEGVQRFPWEHNAGGD